MNCSIPTDLIEVGGDPQYVRCGKKATHKVVNSDWYICEGHVEYAKSEGWPVRKIKRRLRWLRKWKSMLKNHWDFKPTVV